MSFKAFYLTITCFLLARVTGSAEQLPQNLDNKPQETQYKEVIMYLTPSQIRDYENSQRNLESKSKTAKEHFKHNGNSELHHQIPQRGLDSRTQYELNQYSEPHTNYLHTHQNELNLSQRQIQTAEKNRKESDSDKFNTERKQQQPFLYLDINPHVPHSPAPERNVPSQQNEQKQLFYPDPDYLKQIVEHNQLQQQFRNLKEGFPAEPHYHKYQLVPYEYKSENQKAHENLGKQILEQVIRPQLAPLQADESQSVQPNNPKRPQNAPNYSNQKIAFSVESLLNEIRLEKLNAQAKADAIAKSPPVVVHRDISILRRRPTHIIKTIKVPVPAPFLVPVPEPYEVKVPQPYPVPVEIIRPYAVPIVKTEKIEVERPVPVEVVRHVPVPVEKKVYVDVEKPYTVERVVPVHVRREVPVEVQHFRPEKLTILRHVWTR